MYACAVDERVRVVASSKHKPKARRKHTCVECGKIINKGEQYVRYSGVSLEYDLSSHATFPWRAKICLLCEDDIDVMSAVDDAVTIFGCFHDRILDALNLGLLDQLGPEHPFWATRTACRWQIYRDEDGDAYHVPK